MRIQSQIIIAIICINAAIAFYDGAGALGLVPSFEYAHPLTNSTYSGGEPVQYGNASDVATQWTKNPPSVIGIIGDIVGGLPIYFKVILDVIGGLPMLVAQLASAFALDTVSASALLLVSTLLGTPFGFLMFSYIVELITGRVIHD